MQDLRSPILAKKGRKPGSCADVQLGRPLVGSFVKLRAEVSEVFVCFTLWIFNIAMENGPFIDGLPIKNGDFPWLC